MRSKFKYICANASGDIHWLKSRDEGSLSFAHRDAYRALVEE